MRVNGEPRRTIWREGDRVAVIDQTALPGRFEVVQLASVDDAARAIREMWIRGAPLIGVTAAFGLWLAMRDDPSDEALAAASSALLATRPTAVNLRWALDRVRRRLATEAPGDRARAAEIAALRLAEHDVETCRAIGEHGAARLREVWTSLGSPRPFHVLTHCNAGWLATVDWGTALAPIYKLHRDGVPVHVWVSETRPRNQGLLTEWELRQEEVPHTLIVDNAAGHLLARGMVHACIVGSDRTTANGDVCNKIGTYLKALAAREAGVPFFAAVPSSTVDFDLASGDEIPIEERHASEITGDVGISVFNPGFDVTPARLVTGIITERGVASDPSELRSMTRERDQGEGLAPSLLEADPAPEVG